MYHRMMKQTTMNRKRRIISITALLLLLTTTASIYSDSLLLTWNNWLVSYRLRSWLRKEDPKNYIDKKKILFWNTMFGDEWFYMGDNKHFDNCPLHNNCYATNWRWMINVTEFDAILFHSNELKVYDLPERRDPKQIYVFTNLESPANSLLNDNLFDDNFFNATMTYRLDSDVPWPYRIIRNIDDGDGDGDGDKVEIVAPSENVKWKEPSLDLLRRKLDTKFDKKKKMAAWFVSNCKTKGKRESFVEELAEYIQVDVMGGCANWHSTYCSISKDCFAEIIEPDYFYYLSFENALCKDYVTEKFYNPLR